MTFKMKISKHIIMYCLCPSLFVLLYHLLLYKQSNKKTKVFTEFLIHKAYFSSQGPTIYLGRVHMCEAKLCTINGLIKNVLVYITDCISKYF